MGGFYRFPPLAKLGELTSKQQVQSLFDEVEDAMYELYAMNSLSVVAAKRDSMDVPARLHERRVAYGMALMDVIHAAETSMRMEFSDAEVAKLREDVERKNRERGYYGE